MLCGRSYRSVVRDALDSSRNTLQYLNAGTIEPQFTTPDGKTARSVRHFI
jgi:hypothetical protein